MSLDKRILKEIILWQQSFIPGIQLQERDINIEPGGNYVFVGLRRAGKTYMLYQHIRQLLRQGHDIREILFINFEDERITDMRKEDLHLVIDAYRELFAYEPIIFLDEIQNIEGWEHFARRLADEGRNVFITGSNAHMLSREIASTLGGRFLIREIWPFTFTEYLQFQGVMLKEHWSLSPQKADVVRLLSDYFYFGGLSESFRFADKRLWLTSLYQKVLYSDIITRKSIRNERSISLLIRKLADSVMQPMAMKRLQNILQGDGTKINRSTIGTYISYLEEAFLCEMDWEETERELAKKIKEQEPLTAEDQMRFIVLPLTHKGKQEKQECIRRCFSLARKVADVKVQTFILSGMLVFSDKVITKEDSKQIKEWIMLTKVGQLFEEEKLEAVKEVTKEAEKRLEAIKEFNELGSGFKIAMRDLSIRGSGDLLGAEQSGFVESVGIEMYMKILNCLVCLKKIIK